MDATQVKRWKKDLTAVKSALKAKEAQFVAEIDKAVAGLTPEAAGKLLLDILHRDMEVILTRYVAAQRAQIVTAFETWWDKYRVTLISIEAQREAAAGNLRRLLGGLGYGV